ncbi:MAG: ATP-binding protein, partial [Eggerthellaceae bacterium]
MPERMKSTIVERKLCAPDAPALLMVSGGSDSTALAYAACELREAGELGQLAMLHVNHQLRGEDADADARFVAQLAELL